MKKFVADEKDLKPETFENLMVAKTENIEAINGVKYYYFGRTYMVMNLKTSLARKRKKLLEILDEVNNDILLQNLALKSVKDSISDIIYNKIAEVDYKIQVKKFRIRFFKFNIWDR